ERALVLDPNHAWAWLRKAYGLVYLGRPDDAIKAFQSSLRLSPMDPFAFNMLLGTALAHFAADRPQEAVEFASRAIAERPGLSWPFRDLASYYAALGDMTAAQAALDKFRHERPGIDLATIRDSLRFMHPDLLEKYLAGLAKAGLEERAEAV
ncbi:MAG: tetratricopeptide repeat protein, partial [Caulobacteraceae bacterium]